ncbi:Uncharacterized protein PCOAH_00003030 [Plasmodium coatneyi]|uniref:USP domain-containing protein n=1 Tax=Plasmodium coatneyi TaxID=208452 RepID=A0A1B1DTH6_9APIC|nr:Uncharacterized protein PCOAH_00003030 [Plasmodium coatneyi]ANQ06044.1 Uncharacterized protein PCOAH_00003030 [Plasmodium coatneyi]
MRERISTKTDKPFPNDDVDDSDNLCNRIWLSHLKNEMKAKGGNTCSTLKRKKSGNGKNNQYSSSYDSGDTHPSNHGGEVGHWRENADQCDEAAFFFQHKLKGNMRKGSTLTHGSENEKQSSKWGDTIFPAQFGPTDDVIFPFVQQVRGDLHKIMRTVGGSSQRQGRTRVRVKEATKGNDTSWGEGPCLLSGKSRKDRHDHGGHQTTNGYHEEFNMSDMYSCDGNIPDVDGIKVHRMGEWGNPSKPHKPGKMRKVKKMRKSRGEKNCKNRLIGCRSGSGTTQLFSSPDYECYRSEEEKGKVKKKKKKKQSDINSRDESNHIAPLLFNLIDMHKNNLSKADEVTVKKSFSHYYYKGERTRGGAEGRGRHGGQFDGASPRHRKNGSTVNGAAGGGSGNISSKICAKNNAHNNAKNNANFCAKNIRKKISKHTNKYIAEDEDGDEEGIFGETQDERKRKKKSCKSKSSNRKQDTAEEDDQSGNCSSRKAGTKNYAQGRRETLHDDSRISAPEWHFVRSVSEDEASGQSAEGNHKRSHRSDHSRNNSRNNSDCKRGSRRSSISVSLLDGGPLLGGNLFPATETEGEGSPPISPKYNARVVPKSGGAATPSGSHNVSEISSAPRSDCPDEDISFKRNSKQSQNLAERTMNNNSYSFHDEEEFKDADQDRYAEEESPPQKELEQRGRKNKKKNSKGIDVDGSLPEVGSIAEVDQPGHASNSTHEKEPKESTPKYTHIIASSQKKKKNSSEIHDDETIHDEKKTSVKDNVYENFIREYQNLQSLFSFNKERIEEGGEDDDDGHDDEDDDDDDDEEEERKKREDPFGASRSRVLNRDVNESLREDVLSKNNRSTRLPNEGYANPKGETSPRGTNRSDKGVESLDQLSYNFGQYNKTDSIDKVDVGVVPRDDSPRSRGKGLGGNEDTDSSGVVPIGDDQQEKTHSSEKENDSGMNEEVTHEHVGKNRKGQKSADVDDSVGTGSKKNKTEGSTRRVKQQSSGGNLQSRVKRSTPDGETGDVNGVRSKNSDLLVWNDLMGRGDMLAVGDTVGKMSLSSNKTVPNGSNYNYFEYEANNSKKLLHRNMSSMYSMNGSNLTFHQDFFKDILLLSEEKKKEKKKKKSSKQHSSDHFDQLEELPYFDETKNGKHSKKRSNYTHQEDEFNRSLSSRRDKFSDRKSSSAAKSIAAKGRSLREEEGNEEDDDDEDDVDREESDEYGDYDGEAVEGGGCSYDEEDLHNGDHLERSHGPSESHKERRKKKKLQGEHTRKSKSGKLERVKIVEEKNKPHKRKSIKEKRNCSRTHNNSICSLEDDDFYDDVGYFPYHERRGRHHDATIEGDPPDDNLHIDMLDDLHKDILAYPDEVHNHEDEPNLEKAKRKRKTSRRKKEDLREEYMKEFFSSVLDNQIYKKNLNSKDFCRNFAPEGEEDADAEEGEKHMLRNISKVIRAENINTEIELLRNEIMQTKMSKESLPNGGKKKDAYKSGHPVEMTHRKKKSNDKEEEKRNSLKVDPKTGKDGSHKNTFATHYQEEEDYYTPHHEKKKRESHVKVRDANVEEEERFRKSKGRSKLAGRDRAHSFNEEGRGVPTPHGNNNHHHHNNSNSNNSGGVGVGGLHLNKSLEFFSNNFLSLKRFIERRNADTNYDAKREDDYGDKADEQVDVDFKKKKKNSYEDYEHAQMMNKTSHKTNRGLRFDNFFGMNKPNSESLNLYKNFIKEDGKGGKGDQRKKGRTRRDSGERFDSGFGAWFGQGFGTGFGTGFGSDSGGEHRGAARREQRGQHAEQAEKTDSMVDGNDDKNEEVEDEQGDDDEVDGDDSARSARRPKGEKTFSEGRGVDVVGGHAGTRSGKGTPRGRTKKDTTNEESDEGIPKGENLPDEEQLCGPGKSHKNVKNILLSLELSNEDKIYKVRKILYYSSSDEKKLMINEILNTLYVYPQLYVACIICLFYLFILDNELFERNFNSDDLVYLFNEKIDFRYAEWFLKTYIFYKFKFSSGTHSSEYYKNCVRSAVGSDGKRGSVDIEQGEGPPDGASANGGEPADKVTDKTTDKTADKTEDKSADSVADGVNANATDKETVGVCDKASDRTSDTARERHIKHKMFDVFFEGYHSSVDSMDNYFCERKRHMERGASNARDVNDASDLWKSIEKLKCVGYKECKTLLKLCLKNEKEKNINNLKASKIRSLVISIWSNIYTSRPKKSFLKIIFNWLNSRKDDLNKKKNLLYLLQSEKKKNIHLQRICFTYFLKHIIKHKEECSNDLIYSLYLIEESELKKYSREFFETNRTDVNQFISIWNVMCILFWDTKKINDFAFLQKSKFYYYDFMLIFFRAFYEYVCVNKGLERGALYLKKGVPTEVTGAVTGVVTGTEVADGTPPRRSISVSNCSSNKDDTQEDEGDGYLNLFDVENIINNFNFDDFVSSEMRNSSYFDAFLGSARRAGTGGEANSTGRSKLNWNGVGSVPQNALPSQHTNEVGPTGERYRGVVPSSSHRPCSTDGVEPPYTQHFGEPFQAEKPNETTNQGGEHPTFPATTQRSTHPNDSSEMENLLLLGICIKIVICRISNLLNAKSCLEQFYYFLNNQKLGFRTFKNAHMVLVYFIPFFKRYYFLWKFIEHEIDVEIMTLLQNILNDLEQIQVSQASSPVGRVFPGVTATHQLCGVNNPLHVGEMKQGKNPYDQFNQESLPERFTSPFGERPYVKSSTCNSQNRGAFPTGGEKKINSLEHFYANGKLNLHPSGPNGRVSSPIGAINTVPVGVVPLKGTLCRSEEDTDENCITYDDMFRNYDSENNSEGKASPDDCCNVKEYITSLHFHNPLEEKILSRKKGGASLHGEKKGRKDNDDGEGATNGDNMDEENSYSKEGGTTVGEANGSTCPHESKEDLFGSNATRVGIFPMETSLHRQSSSGQNYHINGREYKNGGTKDLPYGKKTSGGGGNVTSMMMPPDPFGNENNVMKKFPSLGVLDSEDEKVENGAVDPKSGKGLPLSTEKGKGKRKDSLKNNTTTKGDGSNINNVAHQMEHIGNHPINGPLNEFPYENPMQGTPPGSALSKNICIKKNPLNDNYQEVDFTTSILRRKNKSGESNKSGERNKSKKGATAQKYLMLKVDTFELKRMTRSKLKYPPVGLVNLGNTCYLNSLLQALYSTVSFVVNLYLFNIRHNPKEGIEHSSNPFAGKEIPTCGPNGINTPKGPMQMHRLSTMDGLNNLNNSLGKMNTLTRLNTLNGTTPINHIVTAESERFLQELKNFYIIMTTTNKTYVSPDCILGLLPYELNNRNQQDVTELLRYIFDKLGGSSKEFLRLIFSGVLVQKVQCQKCFFVSKKEEVIHDLSFPVPVRASERLSIQKYFDSFVQKEKIHGSNKYRCSKCNKRRNALKWNEIISPPCHLILILNRYNWSFSSNEKKKVKTHVKVNSKIVVNNFDYKLYGAIIHGGSSASSGHYYFIGKKSERDPQDETNDWYQMNDSVITKTSSKSINRISKDPSNDHTPYVLFYRCKQAPPSPALHF